jgi:type IV secretion system protein TrbD
VRGVLISMNTNDSPDLTRRVRKQMLERFVIFGVPRRLVGIYSAFVIVPAIVTRDGWLLLAVVPAHLIAWLLTKKDPEKFETYLRYRSQGDRYQPRDLFAKGNARPRGFGREGLSE